MSDYAQQLSSIQSAFQAAAKQRTHGYLTPDIEEPAAIAIWQFQHLLRTAPEIAAAFKSVSERISELTGESSEFFRLRAVVAEIDTTIRTFFPGGPNKRQERVLRRLMATDAFRDAPKAYIDGLMGLRADLLNSTVPGASTATECVGKFIEACQLVAIRKSEWRAGWVAAPYLAADPNDDLSAVVGDLSANVLAAMASCVLLMEQSLEAAPTEERKGAPLANGNSEAVDYEIPRDVLADVLNINRSHFSTGKRYGHLTVYWEGKGNRPTLYLWSVVRPEIEKMGRNMERVMSRFKRYVDKMTVIPAK